jgi:hypothetical protein
MESNCCTVSRAAVGSERVVAYLNDAEFPAAAPRTVFSGIRFVVLPWRVLFGISRDLDVVFFVMNTRSFFEYFFFSRSPLTFVQVLAAKAKASKLMVDMGL